MHTDPHEEEESKPAMTHTLLQSNYPGIRFWTREEWAKYEAKMKGSSDPIDQAGPQGKKRGVQGQNILIKYIQQPDGSLISGVQAKAIRKHARSIWIDLYTRGLAPKMWSKVPRSVEDKYVHEMEEQWPIL